MNPSTMAALERLRGNYTLVVIGTSLGGLRALRSVLSELPRSFRLPLAVVQHRTADAGDPLQVVLQQLCALRVVEAEDKTRIEPATVYLAPPNYHLLIEDDHFALSTEDAVLYARPSINVLFESAARALGARVIGVVMTGTGTDGAQGLAALQDAGGLAIVEHPSSALMAEMPQAAADAARGALALTREEIGRALVQLGGERGTSGEW